MNARKRHERKLELCAWDSKQEKNKQQTEEAAAGGGSFPLKGRTCFVTAKKGSKGT